MLFSSWSLNIIARCIVSFAVAPVVITLAVFSPAELAVAETGYGSVSATIRVTATVEPATGVSRSLFDPLDPNDSDDWLVWRPAGERLMIARTTTGCCRDIRVLAPACENGELDCVDWNELLECNHDPMAPVANGDREVATTILIVNPDT